MSRYMAGDKIFPLYSNYYLIVMQSYVTKSFNFLNKLKFTNLE